MFELSEDDKLWRDQNVPNVSDDDFKKMLEVMGGNGNGNGNGKAKDKEKDKRDDKELEPKKKQIPIKKYSGNSKGPLHEAIVINGVPKFVTLDKLTHKPN
jgi:hypothetical protein